MGKLTPQEQEALKQGDHLRELVNLKGWGEIIKPYLEGYLHHSWVNPRECKDVKEFGWQELQRADYAQFVKEFLAWVEGQIEAADFLRKKERGEVKDDFRDIFRSRSKEVKKDGK